MKFFLLIKMEKQIKFKFKTKTFNLNQLYIIKTRRKLIKF